MVLLVGGGGGGHYYAALKCVVLILDAVIQNLGLSAPVKSHLFLQI
jgi:UDP-N-acetylglucosamine:LPS N-acetylglucosamine transferase